MVGFDIRFNLIFRSSYLLNFIFLVIRVDYTVAVRVCFRILSVLSPVAAHTSMTSRRQGAVRGRSLIFPETACHEA